MGTATDYNGSSYKANAYGGNDDFIDKHVIYDKLSTDEAVRMEYRTFVHQMQRKNESMRGEMEGRSIYGSSDFIQRIHKRFKLDAVIKKRGRPKKESLERQNK